MTRRTYIHGDTHQRSCNIDRIEKVNEKFFHRHFLHVMLLFLFLTLLSFFTNAATDPMAKWHDFTDIWLSCRPGVVRVESASVSGSNTSHGRSKERRLFFKANYDTSLIFFLSIRDVTVIFEVGDWSIKTNRGKVPGHQIMSPCRRTCNSSVVRSNTIGTWGAFIRYRF